MADAAVEQLVDYVTSGAATDLSCAVIHQAKRRAIDTMGCALAAVDAPPARIARELAIPVCDAFTARVIGDLARTTPDLAAFANGVMVRYLDMNDDSGLPGSGAHPSDNFPAVLAVAEAMGASGIDFIRALTISYQVQCRIVDSAPFNLRGWDQPIAGGIAAAAACGKLLNLTRDQLREAVALALTPSFSSYQTRIGDISMWKACAGAHGARQGVFAAVLAAKGMTGPADPISGKFGLWALTTGEMRQIRPYVSNTERLFITRTVIKKHPVRNAGQLMVDTALDLHDKLARRNITALRIRTFRSAFKSKDVECPQAWAATSRETADHSVLFAVAATLLDGSLTPDSYDRRRYLDHDIHGLIKNTRLDIENAFDRDYEIGVRNCAMEATLSGGASVASHLKLTAEDMASGPSDADIESKFNRLTQRMLRPLQQRALLDVLWNLENVENVKILLDHTGVH